MPSPKDPTPPSPAPPTAPAEPAAPTAVEAGEVSAAAATSATPEAATPESVAVKVFKPMTKQEAKEQGVKLHFIEIKLIDQDKDPVPHEPFRITMPDGSVHTGTLDKKGVARVEGIPDTGNCKVTFPSRDKSTWDKN
ncbi:MAG: hypothetical protein WD749_15435 [Phycisphaerales bacterium]